MSRSPTLLKITALKKHYFTNSSLTDRLLGAEQERIKAVDGISFRIAQGESFAIVGESGCGKSTAAESILNLRTPTDGEISYKGDIVFPEASTNREYRDEFREQSQIVFQDPNSSLNSRMTIESIVTEPLAINGIGTTESRRKKACDLLKEVGLGGANLEGYPHEFSGGQQQRIAIARALSVEPDLMVLDEPVSALDVSVQAQILNLVTELKEEHGLTYLIISHNLAAVNHISDRVGVMYLGEFVEKGETNEIFQHPQHPYTEALLNGVPQVTTEERHRDVELLTGDVPSAKDPPSGCRFHTRCKHAREVCKMKKPSFLGVEGQDDQQSACFRNDDGHEYWHSGPLRGETEQEDLLSND